MKIMLLDDNPQHSELLYKYLVCQHDVEKVYKSVGIDEAYHMIDITSPDIVITDIVLGTSSVFSLFNRLNLNPVVSDSTHYIILSASKNNTLIKKAVEFGICDYISKPVDTSILMDKIRKILNGRIQPSKYKLEDIIEYCLYDIKIYPYTVQCQYIKKIVELLIDSNNSLEWACVKTAEHFLTTGFNVERELRKICRAKQISDYEKFIYDLVEHVREYKN